MAKIKYLKLKAFKDKKELEIKKFICSNGYFDSIMNRHGFVSRVHTFSILLLEMPNSCLIFYKYNYKID